MAGLRPVASKGLLGGSCRDAAGFLKAQSELCWWPAGKGLLMSWMAHAAGSLRKGCVLLRSRSTACSLSQTACELPFAVTPGHGELAHCSSSPSALDLACLPHATVIISPHAQTWRASSSWQSCWQQQQQPAHAHQHQRCHLWRLAPFTWRERPGASWLWPASRQGRRKLWPELRSRVKAVRSHCMAGPGSTRSPSPGQVRC